MALRGGRSPWGESPPSPMESTGVAGGLGGSSADTRGQFLGIVISGAHFGALGACFREAWEEVRLEGDVPASSPGG